MEILKLGQCPICSKKMIANKNNKIIFLGNYRTIWTRLSDNSIMEVAICSSCLIGLNDERIKQIMDIIRYTWEQEIKIEYKEKEMVNYLNKIKTLNILKYNLEKSKI